MSVDVLITGIGPASGLGLGLEANWAGLFAGTSAVAPVRAFDASGFDCGVACELPEDFKVRSHVPKSYRKATKVMARDIEIAVAAADYAVRDAGLVTAGTTGASDGDAEISYAPQRMGCHIGSGLIAADLDELTAALVTSVKPGGATNPDAADFDLHHWGREGMQHLTPLWLLKYLPNMLACHVTIIHAAHGPSNTITCGEASGGLSIGESLRVIQRGKADVCFCGGASSQLNPMGYYRQELQGRLVKTAGRTDADTAALVRPFDQRAAGMVVGEGGGIVVLESAETFATRAGDKKAYARVAGFAATQTVNREHGNLQPDAQGKSIAAAIRSALREAKLSPDAIDFVVPFGSGCPPWDAAEAAAMHAVFGDALADIPVLALKANVGNLCAGAGGYELGIAAQCLAQQQLPPILNRTAPLPGLAATTRTPLRHAVVFATGLGGQNTATVLQRFEA